MTVSVSLWQARESMLKLFRHRREGFVKLEEQPCTSGSREDAQRRIRRLTLDELARAGLIGKKLNKLQQAEIGLKVSRRLLDAGVEGRRSP